MIWFRIVAVALACVVASAVAGPAAAGAPTDHLKGAIDRVIKTLEDPSLKGEGKAAERRHAVRKIADELFDFGEIAKRSLARHWQPLSEKQREEFVALFSDLLERSYIGKIELYGGEKIQYTNERVDGDYAIVTTKIITKNGTEVPVDYRMLKRGDRWLVYDVNIDGDKVAVKMTLTAPGCPASGYISQDVRKKIEGMSGVKKADVIVVWDPPWSPDMMSETAKKQFGWGL